MGTDAAATTPGAVLPAGWQLTKTKEPFLKRLARRAGWTVAVLLFLPAVYIQVRWGIRPAMSVPGVHAHPRVTPAQESPLQVAASILALAVACVAFAFGCSPRTVLKAWHATVTVLVQAVGTFAWRFPRAAVLTLTVGWAVSPWTVPWGWAVCLTLAAVVPWIPVLAGRFADWRHPKLAPEPPLDERVATWRTLVAAHGCTLPDGSRVPDGPLPGCVVSQHVQDIVKDGQVVGFRLLVAGRDVRQHAGVIEQALPAIAAAYRTAPGAVTLRHVGDHLRAEIDILTAEHVAEKTAERLDRLMTPRDMIAPCLDAYRGIATFGHVAEDGAPLMWTLWTPGQGTRHGWVIGGTGSGKSALLSNLLASFCSVISALGSGLVCPHIIDLAGGASLPEWDGLATSFAVTVPEARRVLQRLEKLYESRLADMRVRGLTEMEASVETPVHVAVVEESPEMVGDPESMRIIDRLVRLGRKALIAVIWVSQSGDAVRVFGSAGTSMRQQLKAGNIVALFLTGESVGQALSGARDAGEKPFDAATVIVPKDTPGACVAWTPEHKVPTLGRAYRLTKERRRTQVAGWVSIPADAAWAAVLAAEDAPMDATDDDLDTEPITEEGSSNADRAWAAIRRRWAEPGEVFTTGQVLTETGISPSSLDYALKVLVRRRQVHDLGYRKWSRAA